MAVCSSVAAPPKARPQTATAAYTRAGASAATPSISVDKANSAMLASVSARRSEEHTSELQSQSNLVCRLLLEKKKRKTKRQARSNTRCSLVLQTDNRSSAIQ